MSCCFMASYFVCLILGKVKIKGTIDTRILNQIIWNEGLSQGQAGIV
jgi:hypothetical protein